MIEYINTRKGSDKMRIITGSAKGARLVAPKGLNTRPTADRVKESLFNILSGEVIGKKVLDLFAGTGNLGIEALSRGANFAAFVDFATDKIIRENLKRVHFEEKSAVFRGDVFKILKRLENENNIYDLIFLDPPYFKGLSQKTLEVLNSSSIFSDNGIIVVEHGLEEEFTEYSSLKKIREVSYGKTTGISFFAGKGKND